MSKYQSGKRSAWLILDQEVLDRMLNLPDNLHLAAIVPDLDTRQLKILLVGADLEEVPMNSESTVLPLVISESEDGPPVIEWESILEMDRHRRRRSAQEEGA